MKNLDYEPLKEIVIHIGEKKEYIDTEPIRVYVDGEQIENLRGFKFEAKMGESPEMTVKRAIFCSLSNLDQHERSNPCAVPVKVHNPDWNNRHVETVDNSCCKP